MVCGVDSVTVDNNVVIGSASGGAMGKGPGKDSGIDLVEPEVINNGHSGSTIELSDDNSLARREGLDTDPDSGMFLALILEEIVGRLPMSEGELTEDMSSPLWACVESPSW